MIILKDHRTLEIEFISLYEKFILHYVNKIRYPTIRNLIDEGELKEITYILTEYGIITL